MLFTLQTFSTTGGIQKMTRTLAHALNQLSVNNKWDFKLWSAYDSSHDLQPQYLPAENFKGFGKNQLAFTVKAIKAAAKADILIISHINLAIVGLAVKIINPKCKVWLIAHGIEVWRKLSFYKYLFIKHCNKVLCVSNFTKQQVVTVHKIDAAKCTVLNNAIDPFMKLPVNFTKPLHLMERYQLTANNPVLFTLTRLNSAEQYKGYEQVIKIINKLKYKFPGIKYIISGQYDLIENARIKQLINENKIEDQVILTGFIDETELSEHFLLADLFVLPSKGEGFGIVIIEALACGLPVVCGNIDGSIDAIKNGELGKAINPENLTELENAVTAHLKEPLTETMRQKLQDQCLFYFNDDDYKNKLQQLLNNELAC